MKRRASLAGALLLFVAATDRAPAQSAAAIGVFENHSDVGTVLHPGTAEYDAARRIYTVTGSGDNMWAASDAFQFVWKKVSGDVTLTADVAFTGTGGEAHRKGVLMIRQSLDNDSAYVDAALHGNGLTSIQARDARGAITHEVQSYVSAPRRARIQKRGRNFYMFVAGEGGELKPSGGSMQVAFDEPFYVGIGVCAHNKDAVEKIVFSNVSLDSGTPQGSPVLYSTLEVVRLAAATDHRAVVVEPGRIESPVWTRDGAALTFFSRANGRAERVLADGGTPEPAEAPLASDGRKAASPDGAMLAFAAVRNGRSDIYTTPAAGGPEKRLTTSARNEWPQYSPDGAYIYFNSDRAGTMQIWRMKPDGSSPEQVTAGDFDASHPHLSPDGLRLAFLSHRQGVAGSPRDQEAAIRIMTLSNKRTDVLARMLSGTDATDAPAMDLPAWSPDSRRIAFVSYQLIPK